MHEFKNGSAFGLGETINFRRTNSSSYVRDDEYHRDSSVPRNPVGPFHTVPTKPDHYPPHFGHRLGASFRTLAAGTVGLQPAGIRGGVRAVAWRGDIPSRQRFSSAAQSAYSPRAYDWAGGRCAVCVVPHATAAWPRELVVSGMRMTDLFYSAWRVPDWPLRGVAQGHVGGGCSIWPSGRGYKRCLGMGRA